MRLKRPAQILRFLKIARDFLLCSQLSKYPSWWQAAGSWACTVGQDDTSDLLQSHFRCSNYLLTAGDGRPG